MTAPDSHEREHKKKKNKERNKKNCVIPFPSYPFSPSPRLHKNHCNHINLHQHPLHNQPLPTDRNIYHSTIHPRRLSSVHICDRHRMLNAHDLCIFSDPVAYEFRQLYSPSPGERNTRKRRYHCDIYP